MKTEDTEVLGRQRAKPTEITDGEEAEMQ